MIAYSKDFDFIDIPNCNECLLRCRYYLLKVSMLNLIYLLSIFRLLSKHLSPFYSNQIFLFIRRMDLIDWIIVLNFLRGEKMIWANYYLRFYLDHFISIDHWIVQVLVAWTFCLSKIDYSRYFNIHFDHDSRYFYLRYSNFYRCY